MSYYVQKISNFKLVISEIWHNIPSLLKNVFAKKNVYRSAIYIEYQLVIELSSMDNISSMQ